jgi:hypothetical protein
MTLAILELIPNTPLPLTPTTTVFSGTVRLGKEGLSAVVRGQPPDDFGFFIPDAPPLDEAAEAPPVLAELHLMFLDLIDARYQLGVDQVTAAYLPDPRGGTARWLHCGGRASAARPIRIGYRVTVATAPARRAEATE